MKQENSTSTQQISPIGGPPIYKMPLIGERAAPFVAETTKGPISFPFDYEGRWVIFFSHPGDFEPVCTTEFIALQLMQEDFKARNAELLGLSVDSLASHLAWIQEIYQMKFDGLENVNINFPIVADPFMEISKRYGMVHSGDLVSNTVRALFIIDPNSIIRAILYYPPRVGRNTEEIMRVLIALQTADAQDVALPANWEPGEPVIIRPPTTTAQLIQRLEQDLVDPQLSCPSWYLCFRPDETNPPTQTGTIKRSTNIQPPPPKKPTNRRF